MVPSYMAPDIKALFSVKVSGVNQPSTNSVHIHSNAEDININNSAVSIPAPTLSFNFIGANGLTKLVSPPALGFPTLVPPEVLVTGATTLCGSTATNKLVNAPKTLICCPAPASPSYDPVVQRKPHVAVL